MDNRRQLIVARTAGVVVLALAAVAVATTVLGAGQTYEVTAEFENASQLVAGNEVVLAGQSVGTVEKIELSGDNGALVTFTVDQEEYTPLRRGTTATIRSFSLSGIANRQIQLTLPGEGEVSQNYPGGATAAGEEIPDGGTLSRAETISEVDLDQIFNTLDQRTVRNLKKVIKGFEVSYDGVGEQANRGFKYLNPLLSTSRRVFGELNRDERALQALIVDGSKLSGALAERAPDLEQLIGNLNRFQGALANQKASLTEAVAEFPDFMRAANTTFVNLRAALDDVDPLVDASKPVAVRLRPFFSEFRAAARDAVPTIRDLDQLIVRGGARNDLVDLTRLQPALAEAAVGSGSPTCAENPYDPSDLEVAADNDFTQGAFGETACALRASLPQLAFFRAYTPELVAWFDGFAHEAAIDANGGSARVASSLNTFSTAESSGLPLILGEAQPLSEQLGLVSTDNRSKCPGANERPLPGIDSSAPMATDPTSPTGPMLNCDPSQVLPGP